LFPIADLINNQRPAPGRALADGGASIAIASDCNPHTCYTPSMNLAVALAVLRCGLTPAEAVHAATAGGARPLCRDDVGTLTLDARADLHILTAPSYQYLAYRPGAALTHAVYQRGSRIPHSPHRPSDKFDNTYHIIDLGQPPNRTPAGQ